MIPGQLKIIFRNLWRNKRYSFINIGGLALGITAFLLILEFISFEKSIDTFHKDRADIYRLLTEDGHHELSASVEPGLAPRIKNSFPDIADYCRFEDGICAGVVRRSGEHDTPFREDNIGYAEGNFFNFFSFPLSAGRAKDFNRANVAFISKATAVKYFAKEDPIGESIILFNQFGKTNYTIGGVFTIPDNSDINYDMVFSLETLKVAANLNGNEWAAPDNLSSSFMYTWLRINHAADKKKLEAKLTALGHQILISQQDKQFRLQPFSNVHLAASLSDNFPVNGNLRYIYILGGIALLILCIAWVNYVNLSTAQSLKRAGEVGVRKVLGASKRSLVLQFLTESLIVNFFGLVLSIVFVQLLQSAFNTIIHKNLSLQSVTYGNTWIIALTLLIGGSILSGAYTASSLAGFNPVKIMKGKMGASRKGILLRQSLVVVQFSISVALIISTLLIYQQLKYMQSKQPGLSTEQVLVIKGPQIGRDSSFKDRSVAFINAVAEQHFVKSYSQTGNVPGNGYNYATSGFAKPGDGPEERKKSYSMMDIDDRYLSTYKISLSAGRNFSPDECRIVSSPLRKMILNETAARAFGFESPEKALLARVEQGNVQYEIVGVIKDYHHAGLQQSIDPIIFLPKNSTGYFSLLLGVGQLHNDVAKLEQLYKEYFPGNPYEYFFADEHFNKQYTTEEQYTRLFITASAWAIVIACLGLFGLTTYSIESRTKEIGIRKVIGAGVFDIARLLSIDFLRLVIIAIVIASPIAAIVMKRWLQDFAYHISINWVVFVVTAIMVICVALTTVGWLAIKAAVQQPIKSLRFE